MKRYAALRHLRFGTPEQLRAAMDRVVTERSHDCVAGDYLDGVVFTARKVI